MRDSFERFIASYCFDLSKSVKDAALGGNASKERPVWKLFEEDLKASVKSISELEKLGLDVDGSVGNSGNWLKIPYIRVFDPESCPSPASGTYVVYLFSENGKTLFLTLSTAGSGYNGRSLTKDQMRAKANEVAISIGHIPGFDSVVVNGMLGDDSKAKNYEAGISFFKEYRTDTLPDDETMVGDLLSLSQVYRNYLSGTATPVVETPPALPNYPKNLIFYGAPGTGKTYQTINRAVAIIDQKTLEEVNAMDRAALRARYEKLCKDNRISFVTFHQSYSYEDFIVGIFPDVKSKKLKYTSRSGSFKALCDLAKDSEGNFVMIIDEINRGNISKIFGELITLVEDSKRIGEPEETIVTLPYPDETGWDKFGVPSNVYIIGTMNTADRSIQHVDTALRRRFKFEEVLPDSTLFSSTVISVGSDKIEVGALLDRMNQRIQRYYDREHVIGHSYFIKLRDSGLTGVDALKMLGEIFRESIIPLLQDYFFEDYAKIQRILGEDDDTPNEECLVRRIPETVFDDADEGRAVYEIAKKGDSAYTNIKTYLNIVK